MNRFLVFKDTEAYEKLQKHSRIKQPEIRIIMQISEAYTNLPEPLYKTPRDNLYPLWELTKRLFMRFVALCVCLETGKSQTATNIKLTSN